MRCLHLIERLHGAKKEALPVRDPMAATVNLVIEQNLQFHQHGDISYCELPNEIDRLKHAQKVSAFVRISIVAWIGPRNAVGAIIMAVFEFYVSGLIL